MMSRKADILVTVERSKALIFSVIICLECSTITTAHMPPNRCGNFVGSLNEKQHLLIPVRNSSCKDSRKAACCMTSHICASLETLKSNKMVELLKENNYFN